MVDAAKFWDNIADKYSKNAIKDLDSYEYTLGRTRFYLEPSHRVLEIGCGTGSTALLLADEVDQIIGTDLSSEMIRIASEKAEEQKVQNASFRVLDVAALAHEPHRYDVVMGFNLLHLDKDPEGTISKAYDLLPVGGLFISKTPCLSKKAWMFKPMLVVMRLFKKAPYVGFFSAPELDHMIEDAGFEILETENRPKSLPNRYVVARK